MCSGEHVKLHNAKSLKSSRRETSTKLAATAKSTQFLHYVALKLCKYHVFDFTQQDLAMERQSIFRLISCQQCQWSVDSLLKRTRDGDTLHHHSENMALGDESRSGTNLGEPQTLAI